MTTAVREFDETAAVAILRRAAELEVARTGAIDLVRLREAAELAGISEVALDQAVREHDASLRRAATARTWWRRVRIALTMGGGLYLAVVLGFVLFAWLVAGMGPVDAMKDLFDLR